MSPHRPIAFTGQLVSAEHPNHPPGAPSAPTPPPSQQMVPGSPTSRARSAAAVARKGPSVSHPEPHSHPRHCTARNPLRPSQRPTLRPSSSAAPTTNTWARQAIAAVVARGGVPAVLGETDRTPSHPDRLQHTMSHKPDDEYVPTTTTFTNRRPPSPGFQARGLSLPRPSLAPAANDRVCVDPPVRCWVSCGAVQHGPPVD